MGHDRTAARVIALSFFLANFLPANVFADECAHDLCEAGVALEAGCDPCAESVCEFDPYCCASGWDRPCVNAALWICGENCGRCGDAITQPDLAEQCDDGFDTETCDADCTFVACGDSHANRPAGEQCDDGNSSNDDGCDDECRVVYAATLAGCSSHSSEGFGAGESEHFQLILAQSTVIRLETTDAAGTGCPGDTVIILRNSLGVEFGYDDQGGIGDCSLLHGFLPAGEYRVEVRSFFGTAMPAYRLLHSISQCALCGNGAVEAAEQCDDGNSVSLDGCTPGCVLETCGDGVVQPILGETCDTGGSTAGCDGDCSAVACGDGFANEPAGEQCDDGDSAEDDGCDNECRLAYTAALSGCSSYSSDGIETEESQNFHLVLAEPATIRLETTDATGSACPGDTVIVVWDSDGVQIGYDDDGGIGVCSVLVQFLPAGEYRVQVRGYGGGQVSAYRLHHSSSDCESCGNGAVEGTEMCDDGNSVSLDGCAPGCVLEYCGDGIVQPVLGETCDTGATSVGCDGDCSAVSCGDGFINRPAGEQCDNGGFSSESCDGQCMFVYSASLGGCGFHNSDGTQSSSIEHFEFFVAAQSTLRLEILDSDGENCSFDSVVELFRADGTFVGSNDDGGLNLCSFLEAQVAAGAYRVAVRTFGGGPLPSYRLSFSSDDCEAQVCGDANLDGSVTTADALLALRAAVGVGTCSPSRCDATGDGNVQTSDALRILGKAVGLDVAMNCAAA